MSLQAFIALVTTGLVLTASLGIVGLSGLVARRSSLAASRLLMEQVASLTELRVSSFLQPASDELLDLRDVVAGSLVDLGDADALEAALGRALEADPALSAAMFGGSDGTLLMARRETDGSRSMKRIVTSPRRRVTWRRTLGAEAGLPVVTEDPNDAYDPRDRPWYEEALAAWEAGAVDPVWTDVYVFYTGREPGLTVSAPAVDSRGRLLGALAVDVSLNRISAFLASLEVSPEGRAFVVDSGGRLVASPDPKDLLRTGTGSRPRLYVATESHDPGLAALARQPAFAATLADGGSPATLDFQAAGVQWVAALRPIQVGPHRWAVAVLAPAEDFLGDVRAAQRRHLMLGVALAGVAAVTGLLAAGGIARALRRLVHESDRLRQLHFDDPVPMDTWFQEIHEVLETFDATRTGLRAFQRYLPVELVRGLLAENREPSVGGEIRRTTVWFSDIAGFTTVSEQLTPTQLARSLARYLDAVSRCIQRHQGTVVQFVGDEVMAMWNAPLEVPDHPVLACEAALEAARLVDALGRDDPHGVSFPTRFGLHLDDVAVGHFGTSERLAYGAAGDGVNTASRLEGANKLYGTRILMSEQLASATGDRFEHRRLDRLVVKGRAGALVVHELLGHRGELPEELVRAARVYEQALEALWARRFADAAAGFDQAASLRPEDPAAPLLAARARAFGEHPPPDDWDRAWHMTTK